MATTPFHIAHRGSGDNWTEHTENSYSQAIQSGAKAIEVSVSATSDGVLVCHHDLNTERMTGRNLQISEVTYEELRAVRNNSRSWIGPQAPVQPIPRLKDVLDSHAATSVIFIEDKQGTNTTVLLDLMDSYPDSKDHFVWKQTAGGKHYAEAKARGYKTWGYFVDNAGNAFAELAGRFDFLGIYHGATDDEIKALVAFGKPVICWEIHTRWMRERVMSLGVTGLMCSNFPYVVGNSPISSRDDFASGLRAAGDLPWILGPSYQPTLQPDFSSVSLNNEASSSYTLGSMCPVTKDTYSLSFDMRWPMTVPDKNGSAGIAFGHADDQPYRPTAPATVAGYHLTLNRDGTMRLFARAAGAMDGELLGEVLSDAPKPGVWMRFRVDISPGEIAFTRLDGVVAGGVARSSSYRGGYFGLTKNYLGKQPVEFRQIEVS
ncbi:glycerophosphodiester phosphodiesterase family protein [Arthrobacter sp.]|uniref:glycerophosphodiester phosphodiesterase n=1 Tax=Arthrobacter sp. TaxID=1667 RepID=UPI00339143FF